MPHPGFQRAERMLYRPAADVHGVGHAIETLEHGIDDTLVLPALDAPERPGRAMGFQGTRVTAGRPV